jgi:hypothetical protein
MMVSPVPGSTFSGATVTFQWTAGTATAYGLTLGSSPGAIDIYASSISQVGGSWTVNSYTYKAFK